MKSIIWSEIAKYVRRGVQKINQFLANDYANCKNSSELTRAQFRRFWKVSTPAQKIGVVFLMAVGQPHFTSANISEPRFSYVLHFLSLASETIFGCVCSLLRSFTTSNNKNSEDARRNCSRRCVKILIIGCVNLVYMFMLLAPEFVVCLQ